ncbi:pyridoxamine 5'-phosphate oxidase family protein [Phaeacidiphilus oryzae]|uniref:pyridoxamine 5'-phosphate oxidase family protein n=1 Tax=Phaeacidiphilus oryzae TaxID=348818 RepID=UPI00056A4C5A|nr:pyridoxamine 5'-phosphate oxidase family protein [Phaeacidiphilus oryzae]
MVERNHAAPPSERTRLRRLREQGSHAPEDVDAVLGAGFLCHLGVVVDGTPMVVPTVYGYDRERRVLYLHGSVASRSLRDGGAGEVCVTVTHVDGLVLSRSVFEHGVNYRSAMVYGRPRAVEDEEELLAGLRCLTEQSAPGQWGYARLPNRRELAATALLALDVAEASVKSRSGPPEDGDGPDGELPVWAGVLPLRSTWGEPRPDPALRASAAAPVWIAGRAGTDATAP